MLTFQQAQLDVVTHSTTPHVTDFLGYGADPQDAGWLRRNHPRTILRRSTVLRKPLTHGRETSRREVDIALAIGLHERVVRALEQLDRHIGIARGLWYSRNR